jgi:heme/copper-type cytochrome/quinol oxidase subunit 4
MTDYGKLSEQYGSFLVAVGGVSITVLTLVLSIWHLRSLPAKGEPTLVIEDRSNRVNNRPALITSLIIATFCCFVGAHLMAETSAFLFKLPKGLGARPFLFASVNIFTGVTVVMFSLMLLATEYRRDNQRNPGIRMMSLLVFVAVVASVLWWMVVSIRTRMPAPDQRFALFSPLGLIVVLLGLPYLLLLRGIRRGIQRWKIKKSEKWIEYKSIKFKSIKYKKAVYRILLPITFILITGFTVASLVLFSGSLSEQNGGTIRDWDVMFFVFAITFTCVSLLISGYVMAGKDKHCALWPKKKDWKPYLLW